MKEQCPRCKRTFQPKPEEGIGSIVVIAFIYGEYVETCPLCYSDDIKEMTGSNWNPAGEIAKAMYDEARKQYPNWKPK